MAKDLSNVLQNNLNKLAATRFAFTMKCVLANGNRPVDWNGTHSVLRHFQGLYCLLMVITSSILMLSLKSATGLSLTLIWALEVHGF
ncbi:unnamed protein product [Allacma fusca]|uniref:Uncharacterized protein n=1 Tax=Allacma fusca TaxID=39272 RepID=A0A8J2Q3T5_9HEXA|nr:unnamed protein product [Allacma fusca]